MKPKLSILVGSGLSVPEGLPTVGELNKRLSKIHESEILIHTDQTAMFLNGYNDPNRWSRRDERWFLQEFLEFYNNEILNTPDEFHYETFYDYYSAYLNNQENKVEIEKFYAEFNIRHFKNKQQLTNCYNRIHDFNRSYNQLLASQLHRKKYFEDISMLNYPLYDGFLGFLEESTKTFDIKFHTLNHDLFFDWIGKHYGQLWQHFTDGYKLEGSPYYGRISVDFNQNDEMQKVHKNYYIKLEHFTNQFDKPFAFYKLHGSIFNTTVYTPDNKIVRVKSNYAVGQYFLENQDKNSNEFYFQHLWDDTSPDFLSGTTNKTRYYKEDSYYKILFSHFENNLEQSDLLIIVGYGFKDPGINDILEKCYLSKNKRMLVIDPNKPNCKLLETYEFDFIPKGITRVSFDELNQFILKSNSK